MADLPKYQPTGMLLADIPRVDFANLKENLRATQSLEQSLSRISEFAFKQAGEQAKREGAQYAIENPLTAEQVQKAISEGKKPSELISQPGTIFGESVRSIQAMQLRVELEGRTRNKLAEIASDVDSGRITNFDEIKFAINAPIDGFARVISGIDPEEAVRFKAAMTSAGSTVFKGAYDHLIKMEGAARKTTVSSSQESTYSILSKIYSTETNLDVIEQKIGIERARTFAAARSTNDAEFINKIMNAFEAQVSKRKIDAVSAYVASTEFSADPQAAVKRLDRNDADKMTNIWSSLSFEDQAKIRSNLRTIVNERWDVKEKARKEEEDDATKKSAALLSDYFKTGSAASLHKLNQISILHPKVISPETVFKLPKERTDVLDVANPKAEFKLKEEIMSGSLPTLDLVHIRAKELGISYKRLSDNMVPFFISRSDKDLITVEHIFRNEARIVPGQLNIGQKSADAYGKMNREFERNWAAAVDANKQDPSKPMPTRIEVARDIIKKRQDSGVSKKIESLVSGLNDKYGKGPSAIRKTNITWSDSTSMQDVRAVAKQQGLKPEDIVAIEQTLKQIDALQKQLDN